MTIPNDIAEFDSLDEALASMNAGERDAAIQELEMDGLWSPIEREVTQASY